MKKKLLSILLVLLLFPVLLSAATISWRPGVQLTWSDFQGPADASSPFWANTHYSLKYNYKWDGSGKLSVTVDCFFNTDISWKKNVALTDELLRHEQLHFNVAELYARKMRSAFNAYITSHTYNAQTTVNDLKAIFNALMTECKQYNEQYDEATDHSKNKDKQRKWDSIITRQLQELSAYARND